MQWKSYHCAHRSSPLVPELNKRRQEITIVYITIVWKFSSPRTDCTTEGVNPHCIWKTECSKGQDKALWDSVALSLNERQGHVEWRNFAAMSVEGAFLHLWELMKRRALWPGTIGKEGSRILELAQGRKMPAVWLGRNTWILLEGNSFDVISV